MNHGPYVVLEGPDGTGKTTMADHLVREYGFQYTHCGPPEKDALHNYLDLLRQQRGWVVADRLHVGSWVYGTAFRGGPDMTDYEEWAFEGYLMARGTVMLYCTTSEEVINQNLARGPDSPDAEIYEDPSKRRWLTSLYNDYMNNRTVLPIIKYDYTVGNMGATAAEVAHRVGAMNEKIPRFEAGMIGNSVDPALVLVGEQPHGRVRIAQRFKERGPEAVERALRIIGVTRDRGGALNEGPAGRYLFHATRAVGLGLKDFCVVNAIQWDGRTVDDLVSEDPVWWTRQYDKGNVVALGNVADAKLKDAGVPHRMVPHPQFVRRFHYKRVSEYGKMIMGETPYVAKEWRTNG